MTQSVVAALRRSIARLEAPLSLDDGDAGFSLGHAGADAALGPMPRGALHEIFAAGHQASAASGFAAGLVVRLERGPLVWIRQDFAGREGGELHAPGLAEFGLDPAAVVLVQVRDAGDALKAAGDALPASGLGAVVIEIWGAARPLDLTASRRLALAARASGVAALLLRLGAPPEPSAASIRWSVEAAASAQPVRVHGPGRPAFAVAVLRHRRGVTGRWVMEWDSDERSFREPLPFALVSAPAHRQAPARREAASRQRLAG